MCADISKHNPVEIRSWLSAVPSAFVDHDGVAVQRVHDILRLEVTRVDAFDRLPPYAAPIIDPIFTTSPVPRAGCCCCDHRLGHSDAHAPTELAPQYLNHGPLVRWIRVSLPLGSFARAVEDIQAALGSALLRIDPVYRRGAALLAFRFDTLVLHMSGPAARRDQQAAQLAEALGLTVDHKVGAMAILRGPSAVSPERLRRVSRKPLRGLMFQRIAMRSPQPLGPPRPRPQKRPPPRSRPLWHGPTGLKLAPHFPPNPPSGPLDLPIGNVGGTQRPWHLEAIRVPPADAAATSTSADTSRMEVRVAIIDSPCGDAHPDLEHQTVDEVNRVFGADGSFGFTPIGEDSPFLQNHGTACAGVVVAGAGDPKPIGVATGVYALPIGVRGWWPEDVLSAIERVCEDPNVRVLSMSLAWFDDEMATTDIDALGAALFAAHERGILICAATGNVLDENDTDRTLGFPARLPFVMAVGAVAPPDGASGPLTPKEFNDGSGEVWASRYGGAVSVVAPGLRVCTTDDIDAVYEDFNGTSAATPQVAGLAAMLFAKFEGMTPRKVRYIIEATATKVGDPNSYEWYPVATSSTYSLTCGHGCIDFTRALTFADVRIASDSPASVLTESGSWSSPDVRIVDDGRDAASAFTTSQEPLSGTAQQVVVYVRVHNDGPAQANSPTVRAWLLKEDSVAWSLDRQETGLELTTEATVIAMAEALSNGPFEAGDMQLFRLDFGVPARTMNAPGAHLLISVDVDDDHGFHLTLPAQTSDVDHYNNLTRVHLKPLFR